MRKDILKVLVAGGLMAGSLAMGGCSSSGDAIPAPAPPPPARPPLPPGAIPGTMAADRDGDGVVDGYYTSDGVYHPTCVPPPSGSRGERG